MRALGCLKCESRNYRKMRDKHSAVVPANAGTHSLRSSEAEDINNLRQQLIQS